VFDNLSSMYVVLLWAISWAFKIFYEIFVKSPKISSYNEPKIKIESITEIELQKLHKYLSEEAKSIVTLSSKNR